MGYITLAVLGSPKRGGIKSEHNRFCLGVPNVGRNQMGYITPATCKWTLNIPVE